jgi:predicted nucleic acid-binding protein
MRQAVVGTDVISFLFKGDTRAELYVERLRDRQVAISFMTEAELEQWVLESNWSPKRVEWLRLYLERFVVVPSSSDLSKTWAEVMVSAQRNVRRIESLDAWIAASALLYRFSLAYWRCTSVCSVHAYTSSRRCPANRMPPLPAGNARICSMLIASVSSTLMINPQHPDPALQAHPA